MHRARDDCPLNEEKFMSEEQMVTYELEGEIACRANTQAQLLQPMCRSNCGSHRTAGKKQMRHIFGHGDNFGRLIYAGRRKLENGRSERCHFRSIARIISKRWRGAISHSSRRCMALPWRWSETARPRTSVSRETAYFGLPEGTRGIYRRGGSVRVPADRFCPMQDMMLTSRVLKADEAKLCE